MAWSESKVFSSTQADIGAGTTAIDLNTDVCHAALYNDTITPSSTVASASTAYNAGVWASGEQSDGTNWDAGGEPITSPTYTQSGVNVTFDGVNTPQGGATCTLANVFGCLVYDQTIASPVVDQGICYNYFGGTQGVTGGTFTIVWDTNGIYRIVF